MPNHVCNKIKFCGELEDVQIILNLIAGDNGEAIDFNKILPMPDYIFRGDLGTKEMEKYGENNWYDWSIENWGTKWNAYDAKYIDDKTIIFVTAWNMPLPIYEKLAQICSENNVAFTGYWCEEDINKVNHGTFVGYDTGKFSCDIKDNPQNVSHIYEETWGIICK